MGPGMRYFRFSNISLLFNQMVRLLAALRSFSADSSRIHPHFSRQLAIKDYQGLEMVNPGFLDDLRADAAVAAADMNSAYKEYVRLRCRCHAAQRSYTRCVPCFQMHDLAQRQNADAAAAAAMPIDAPGPTAPPPVFYDRRAISQPTQRPYDPFGAPEVRRRLRCAPVLLCSSRLRCQASMQHVGSLSADALAAMLQEQPAQSVITMHADRSETWAGPLADELRARIDAAAAALVAEGDARSAALTGSLDEKAAQLLAQIEKLSAKADASEARCKAYRLQIEEARGDEFLMMQQCKEEFSGDLWPAFTQLRAESTARLAAEAEARSAAADAAAPAAEAAAAAAARDALASARAAQFEDAQEDDEPLTAAPPAPLVQGAVGDAFFNDSDDEEAVAELELQASAKLRRMDLPATIARVRARIASADPVVQSCLGAVFTGFGAPGTEEEGAVRTVLTYAARELETAIAEREAAGDGEE